MMGSLAKRVAVERKIRAALVELISKSNPEEWSVCLNLLTFKFIIANDSCFIDLRLYCK